MQEIVGLIAGLVKPKTVGICFFCAKHVVLRRKSKIWWDRVYPWTVVSVN
jgi:hypothetical protein